MDSRIGLDYIVENQEYTSKLASGKFYLKGGRGHWVVHYTSPQIFIIR